MNDARKIQFQGLKNLRNFFDERSFIEVMTPPMVQNPGMEVHIHPFKILSAKNNSENELYLHTSPEFAMKELLAEGFEKIYNISYCFRDEPSSSTHRNQFLMLEWYRSHQNYQAIKDDCFELVTKFPESPFDKVQEATLSEIFKEFCHFEILEFLEPKDLYQKIKTDFSKYPVTDEMPWEDLFFTLFLNEVEPHIKNYPALIIDEYPAPLKALSTLKPDQPKVCQRFELYLKGIEVANCFNELIDLDEQKDRFHYDALKKEELYGYKLPKPDVLYKALEKGIPPSAGIALGVERFLMAINNREDLFYT